MNHIWHEGEDTLRGMMLQSVPWLVILIQMKKSSADKIRSLIATLDMSKDSVAHEAIAELKMIGKEALPLISLAARDESKPLIRKWALEALGAIATDSDPQALNILKNALADDRMTVRFHALVGLKNLANPKSHKIISKMLSDESGGIRTNALSTLRALGAKSEKQKVIDRLADDAWYIRLDALKICEEWNLKSAAPALKRLLKTEKRKSILDLAKKILASWN